MIGRLYWRVKYFWNHVYYKQYVVQKLIYKVRATFRSLDAAAEFANHIFWHPRNAYYRWSVHQDYLRLTAQLYQTIKNNEEVISNQQHAVLAKDVMIKKLQRQLKEREKAKM